MIPNWLILCGIALGHACVSAWLINVVHGFGFPEHWMRRVGRGTVAAIGAISVGLVGSAVLGPFADWAWPVKAYGALAIFCGLVGLPIATFVRSIRRHPEGVVAFSSTEVIVGPGQFPTGRGKRAWWHKIPGNESLGLVGREWRVELPGLPEPLDGLSILHISDLHFSDAYDRRYFDRVADEAARFEADLVLFTGDLIDSHDAIAWIEPILSRMRGRLGQFAILGNHDFAQDYRAIYRSVRRAGFPVLEGRWARLDVQGSTLAIGGTSAPWGRVIDPTAVPEADYRILLSHTPDRLGEAASIGVDLVLSGHNHGGQVRLPVLGPILMPSLFSRRFDLGFFRRGRTLLHVSAGVGAKHPLRLNCPPEISRIVLRSADLVGRHEADLAMESTVAD